MDLHNRLLYQNNVNGGQPPPPPTSTAHLVHGSGGLPSGAGFVQPGGIPPHGLVLSPLQQQQQPPPLQSSSSQQSLPPETPPFQSGDDYPRHKRVRVSRACDICRRKKVRCDADGTMPCTNCRTYAFDCSFNDSAKKRGPPKGYIEALENRLKRMESILGGFLQGGDADGMGDSGDRDEDGEYEETASDSDEDMADEIETKQQVHRKKARKLSSSPSLTSTSRKKSDVRPSTSRSSPEAGRRRKSKHPHHDNDHDMSSQSDISSPPQDRHRPSSELILRPASASSSIAHGEGITPVASTPSATRSTNNNVYTSVPVPTSIITPSSPSSISLAQPSPGPSATPINERLENLRLDDYGMVRYLGNSSGLYLLTNKFLFKNGIFQIPGEEGLYLRKLSEDEEYMVIKREPTTEGDDEMEVGGLEAAIHKPVKLKGEGDQKLTAITNGPLIAGSTPPLEVTKEMSDLLINLYFENIHNTLPIINKRIFMRQYRGELNPPPSALLLNAMYAVAARFDDDPSLRTDPDKPVTSGAIFFERAKMYLDRDYVHPRLSTVQALILISSHQNGVAEGSRSWLHAGMAIRMVSNYISGAGPWSTSKQFEMANPALRDRDSQALLVGMLYPGQMRPNPFTLWYFRWSCAGLGRPLAIFDEDCDVEYPNDYDEDEDDEEFATTDKQSQSISDQTIRLSSSEAISSAQSSSAMSPKAPVLQSVSTPSVDEKSAPSLSHTRSYHPKHELAVYSSFIQLIKLSEILGRVLQRLYSPKARALSLGLGSDSLVQLLDDSLTSWRLALPSELQYSPHRDKEREKDKERERDGQNAPMGLGTGAVNGEIFAYTGPLHLCFFTIVLLLHRPFIPSRKNNQPRSSFPSLSICTSAATSIIHIAEKMKMRDFLRFSWSFSSYTVFQASLIHLHNATNTDPRLAAPAKTNLLRAVACLNDMKKSWHIAQKACDMLKMLMELREIEFDEPEDGGIWIHIPPGAMKADSDEKENSTKRVKQENGKEGPVVVGDSKQLGVPPVEADSNNKRDSNGDETRVGVMANLSDVGRGKTPGRESVNSICLMDSAQSPLAGTSPLQSANSASAQIQLPSNTASPLRNRGLYSSGMSITTPPSSASPQSSPPPQTMSASSPAGSQYQASLPSPLSMAATTPSPLSQEIYSLRQFAIPTSKGGFAPTDLDMADFSTGIQAQDMAGLYTTFAEGITPSQLFRTDPTNPFWGMPSGFDWDEWNSYVQDHGQMQFEMEPAQTEIVANQVPLQLDHMLQHPPRTQQSVRGISE